MNIFDGEYEEFDLDNVWPGPKPIRFDDLVPVYTKDQIDECLPDEYGITIYTVIESPVYVNGYEHLPEFRREADKIHVYSRVDRFKTTLYHLLGARGCVPWSVLVLVCRFDRHPDRCWDSIRSILYKHGLAMYYNRIPSILGLLGYGKRIVWTGDVDDIILDFMRMSNKFDHSNDGRYFPNLRFTALRLLELYGCVFEYRIPFLRTKRKLGPANEMWEFLYYG